jgi:hypothetical protein
MALHERGGGLPVVGRAARQPEPAVEEVEEVRVAQLLPEPPPIEVGERDEKVGERGVLAAEEGGELLREFACGHSRIVTSASDRRGPSRRRDRAPRGSEREREASSSPGVHQRRDAVVQSAA